MQVLLSLSFLFMVVGAFLYLWLRGKAGWDGVAELGRISFAMGLLAFLLQVGPQVVNLLD